MNRDLLIHFLRSDNLIPDYIILVFCITVVITFFLLLKSVYYNKMLAIGVLLWLVVQGVIGLSGWYTVTNSMPPRFALLIVPPLILFLMAFATANGRKFMDQMDVRSLTLLHIVRIPVELVLHWLCLYKAVPELMTFKGTNFDLFSGLTAPLIFYFGYVKPILSRRLLIVWNVVCLLLLLNVVITAVLSAPLPFQLLAFDQPNIAVMYFPFLWLPCFIVPTVLFAHLVSLRILLRSGS